jgi:D-serine deaminase-like pyridoxal phosphate-dependent protein
MKLSEVTTPALVVDKRKVIKNIQKMAEKSRSLGVPLRPHVKTVKCKNIVKLLLDEGARGITVSTMKEAEYFFRQGIQDIFLAVPLSPHCVGEVVRLVDQGAKLRCLVDSHEAVVEITQKLCLRRTDVDFLVEIDVDQYRSGVDPSSDEFQKIVESLWTCPYTNFLGLMAYGGRSYDCSDRQEIRELSERFRLALLSAKVSLENRGISCHVLSFGSTPACLFASSMEGITELRCGVYVFQDLFQAGIGACDTDSIAASVLTTVIGKQENNNRLFVDAGGLALSHDRSTRGRSFDAGFGLVRSVEGSQNLDGLSVNSVSQELGTISLAPRPDMTVGDFHVGQKLQILPNHACMTAAAYDQYVVFVEPDGDVEFWDRINGWH